MVFIKRKIFLAHRYDIKLYKVLYVYPDMLQLNVSIYLVVTRTTYTVVSLMFSAGGQ